MAKQVRVLTTLAEDLVQVPGPTYWLTTTCNSGSYAFFLPAWAQDTLVVHRHRLRHTHLHKIKTLITQVMNSLQIQQISLLIRPTFTDAPACELVRCSYVSLSETPQTLKHSLEMIAL